MACNINRNDNGTVISVTADNGNSSLLYKSLSSLPFIKDTEEAAKYYIYITEKYGNKDIVKDENGEPIIVFRNLSNNNGSYINVEGLVFDKDFNSATKKDTQRKGIEFGVIAAKNLQNVNITSGVESIRLREISDAIDENKGTLVINDNEYAISSANDFMQVDKIDSTTKTNSLDSFVAHLLGVGVQIEEVQDKEDAEVSLIQDETNPRIFLALDGNKRIGSLRIKENNEVDAVTISPEYRRQGIAKELYKFANEKLGTIISDVKNTSAAKNIWYSLVREGIAEYDGTQFRMLPNKNNLQVAETQEIIRQNGKLQEVKTEEGKTIQYSSARASNDNTNRPNILWETGETAYIAAERELNINNSFSFQGKNKIESVADVAYLFRNLQEASSENVFAVFTKNNGEFEVLYVSTGGTASAIVDLKLIVARAITYGANKVFFVHNHPSGNLEASAQDINIWNRAKKVLPEDIELGEGVIINLDSGKYTLFTPDTMEEENMEEDGKQDVNIEVKQFARQILYTPSSERTQVRSPKMIAEFISKFKRGSLPKIGVIILNRRSEITKYTLHNDSISIDELTKKALVDAGTAGESIIFVTDSLITANKLNTLSSVFKENDTKIVDIVVVGAEESVIKNMVSFANEDLLNEPEVFYVNEIQTAIQRNNNFPLNLAPNGKPSILYQSYKDLGYSDSEAERLVAQTFSDNFVSWFGKFWVNENDIINNFEDIIRNLGIEEYGC